MKRRLVLLFGVVMARPMLASGAAPVPEVALGAGAVADTLAATWNTGAMTVHLGERVKLRAAVPVPEAGARLVGPSPGPEGPVEVLSGSAVPSGPDSAAWLMEISLFDLGEHDLAGLPFRLTAGARSVPVALRDCRITVLASLPDSAGAGDLRDVKGPVPVPLAWRWGRVAAAFLLLAALVLGVWFLRRRASKPITPVLPLEPLRSPEEVALLALRDLEEDALPGRGRRKEHYVRLSGILRTYVEARYRIPAVESTTEELREALRGPEGRRVGESHVLLEVLEESDLVKFAKADPGTPAAVDALHRSRAWVERGAPAARAEEPVDALG